MAVKPAGQGHYEEMERLYCVRQSTHRLSLILFDNNIIWLVRIFAPYGQCLARRLPDIQTVTTEIAAWVDDRNQKTQPADWRFTTEEARIKLKRLYPKLSN